MTLTEFAKLTAEEKKLYVAGSVMEAAEQEAFSRQEPGRVEKLKTPELRDPWIHRSTGMKCRTCMWFAPKAASLGRCRRHAPTMNGYPVVFESDWCGDHKLDEEKL